ncbi:GTP pyrophosphokinase family protein [Nocardioides jishulii]|uniref:GTP pyrophosphokinase family protein n=1 Tax=Nocardioides jishulii TaxID=2575440 RepID=A0A4U2YIA5_9ACTN|nr:GTP pyrophosphokinase family protein [Nocardioides jishulii]QCX28133.1 GTP pyrophosphokinase family protein [Nocardioides jishulii]TKI60798.1 GTP pyrophosphokinase family protein [Nocardioides jishulii]
MPEWGIYRGVSSYEAQPEKSAAGAPEVVDPTAVLKAEAAVKADAVEPLRSLAGVAPGEDPRDVLRDVRAHLATFMMEYKFALDEVETKTNILREEFELANDYSPIEHVKSRLKSLESLAEKVARMNVPSDLASIREEIRDIAGIRVTTAFVEDTYLIADMLTRQRDLTVLARKDYIAEPKENGYQSLHLVVSVPVFLSDRTVEVPVEVQIRTIAMDFWASVEHQIYYKYAGQVPPHLNLTLTEVARIAAALDMEMGALRSEVQSLAQEAPQVRGETFRPDDPLR